MQNYMPPEIKTRSLYIGNLSPRVTDQLLFEVFSIIGPVENAKVIKDKGSLSSAGFGFVDFYESNTAGFALDRMNGKRIYDMEMKVNWASQTQNLDLSSLFHIFVGDLSPEVDDNALNNAFKNFGPIGEARIMRDPNSNRSKGYGFVAYRNRDDAERALKEMNGEWLGGRAIRCNWANQKNRPGGPGGGPGGNYGGGPPAPDVHSVSAMTTPTNTTVYVGNIGADVSDALIQQVFEDFGKIEEIRIQREKGFAFVRYSTHESAAQAIVMVSGRMMGSRPVKCSWGKDSVSVVQPMGGAHGPHGSLGGAPPPYAREPPFQPAHQYSGLY